MTAPGNLLRDFRQRSRALDPSGSFHLEAPAGSGKTFLLTARFMRLLNVVDHPQQILALTFTNKAAGEMRERVGRFLARAAQGAEPADAWDADLLHSARNALERHRRLRDLLLSGESLHIQTFHSLCYALVSQSPIEAGIVPGSKLMDEKEQSFFLREAIESVLRDIAGRSVVDPVRRALENRLLFLNNSWRLLAGELEDLMRRREALADLVHVVNRQRVSGYVMEGARQMAEVELSALMEVFSATALGASWPSFVKSIRANGGSLGDVLLDDIPGSRWEDLPSWKTISEALLTKSGDVRRKFGPASGYYAGFSRTDWCGLVQGLDPPAVERLLAVRELPSIEDAAPDLDTLWDLILLLHELINAYDERCRNLRLLDFSALETAALRLFDSVQPSDPQLFLDHQVRHVLIDEFQDTSRQQWSLLRHICTGWADEQGRTLFVVGDPKQSIYGFRKAEVSLFLTARDGLPLDSFRVLPLESLVLDTNFRSQPHLIQWCNDLFGGTVMADPRADLDEVPFSGSVASPTTKVDESPAVPELALFAGWPDAESARLREARWLAGRLAEEWKSGSLNSSTGILLFARTHLGVYLEALQERGVPVQVAEGLKLSERPEVRYLWQLCRALVLPQDHLAWACQLRSPWLSLDFGEILAVSREEPAEWVEKIISYSKRDRRVEQFMEGILAARRHLGHEPLAAVMESAWLDLEGARITGERWGTRGLACCRQFFELLREAEMHEPVQTLTRFEQLMDDAYEPVDPDTALSPVSLMTVHRAKGLEFDTVYLPFLDWNPVQRQQGSPQPYLLERAAGRDERYLLATRPDRVRGNRDPMYTWLGRLQTGRRLGEAKRILYVAVTRAAKRVLMSGVVGVRNRDAGLSIPKQTPLSWIDDHFRLSEKPGFREFSLPDDGEKHDETVMEAVTLLDGTQKFLVTLEPGIRAAPVPLQVTTGAPSLQPAPFERERRPFVIVHPSALIGGSTDPGPVSVDANPFGSENARLRGILIHRLLATYGTRMELPPIESIRDTLVHMGCREKEAGEMSVSVRSEVESCLVDPWLERLYSAPGDSRYVEWPVECLHSGRTVYSGVVDLVVFEGGKWRLVDFKTSAPAGSCDIDVFCRGEVEKYRPQVLAYREMWCKMKKSDTADVNAYLYWTALRRAVKL